MADYAKLSCPPARHPSDPSPRAKWKAPSGIPIILAVAAFALAACNANERPNPSWRTAPGAAPGVVAGPNFPNFNPWNPISYAQTSGTYTGRGKARR